MLKPEQYEVIKYLALPKNGGYTIQEIASKAGTTRQSIHRWRKDIEFNDELKREINRNTMSVVPQIIDNLVKQATKENQPSIKAAELVLKTVSMLNDRLEIEDRTKGSNEPTVDVSKMKSEIERFKQRQAK